MAEPYIVFAPAATKWYLVDPGTLRRGYGITIVESSLGDVVTGDRLPLAAPVVFPVRIDEATAAAALQRMRDLSAEASAATEIQYWDGVSTTAPISRRTVGGLKALEVVSWPEVGGVMVVNVAVVPTAAYWVDGGGNKEVRQW